MLNFNFHYSIPDNRHIALINAHSINSVSSNKYSNLFLHL